MGNGRKDELITIENNGMIAWNSLLNSETVCAANALYYPFDQQTCFLIFIPFYYFIDELEMTLTTENVNLNYFQENLVWKLKSATNRNERDINGYYVNTVIELVMKRKPLYFIVNIILPMLLIGILNVFVFLLPADSGERVGFSITILLAMSVFLTIVSNNLPESMSIVSFLLICDLALSVLIVICVILGLRLHFRTAEIKISRKYINLYNCFKCACCKNKSRNRFKTEENDHIYEQNGKLNVPVSSIHHRRQNGELSALDLNKQNINLCLPKLDIQRYHQSTLVQQEHQMGDSNNNIVWKDIGNMIDSICFWSFSSLQVTKLIIYATLFGIQSTSNSDNIE